mmetsp:Transcript_93394/g.237754  ORF Transcript_93394/g.237754 Transcript_93394/m.237754 type:complete len:246 (+) Transcript_93394:1411-2148(+)
MAAVAVATAMAVHLRLQHDAFGVKSTNIGQLRGIHNALHGSDDWGGGVVGSNPVPDLGHLLLIDQIQLVQQDFVREGDLAVPLLVLLAARALGEPIEDGLGVHQGDRAIELKIPCDVRGRSKCPHDRDWVRHAGGLDDDAIQRAARLHLFPDGVEGAQKVAAHRAAHATILHDDHLLCHAQRGVREQLVVDGHRAELVLDHRELLLALVQQQVVEHRGLPGTQEAGEDCDGHQRSRLPRLEGILG